MVIGHPDETYDEHHASDLTKAFDPAMTEERLKSLVKSDVITAVDPPNHGRGYVFTARCAFAGFLMISLRPPTRS
jgi:hypothetical protein